MAGINNKIRRKPEIVSIDRGLLPPQAIDLEEAVLGAIILENDKLQEVLGIIPTPGVFYKSAHEAIYRAVMSLDQKKEKVDLLTVTEELRSIGELDNVGGPFYLTQLTMNVVSSAHVEAHSRILLEKYLARETIRITTQVTNEAYDETNDVFDVLAYAETALNDLTGSVIPSEAKSAKEAAKEFNERMIYLQKKGDKLSGIPSGLGDIDTLLDGWQSGNLIVIGALPGTGKTAFGLECVTNAAMRGYPAAFFSLEMATYELVRRQVCAMGSIPMDELQRGTISDQVKYQKILANYESLPIFLEYTPGINFQHLRAKIRKLVLQHGVKLVVVDYLQIMSGNKEDGNREQQVSKIVMNLKNLAGELSIAIILPAQVDKNLEKESREPVLGDLRESAGIGHHADIVAMLYRASIDPSASIDYSAIETLLKFVKLRNGQAGTKIKLFFNGPFQKFNDSDYIFRQQQQIQFDNPHAGIRADSRPPAEFWND